MYTRRCREATQKNMRIAVFLDVDKTLTVDFIQQEYARVLGCETEYLALEAEFQSKRDSTKFGKELIKLFASRGFTEGKAIDNFARIALQEWTDEMLKLPGVDKYLVSSGPSYYIDTLAKKYEIPDESRCRSIYSFNAETHLIESCVAVGSENKADFVTKAISSQKTPYAITIGVGDSPLMDGPFVAHCTIRLMTVPTDQAIYIPDFNSVILLIRRLSELAKDGVFDPFQLTLPGLMRKMTVERWAFVISSLVALFSTGFAIGRFFR
jgi:phosphoserine phosphatase